MRPVSPYPRRRLRPVRLSDVPLEQRRRAAARLIEGARLDGNLLAAVELNEACERPSGRVYWVVG